MRLQARAEVARNEWLFGLNVVRGRGWWSVALGLGPFHVWVAGGEAWP